jgi:hypothetical protein
MARVLGDAAVSTWHLVVLAEPEPHLRTDLEQLVLTSGGTHVRVEIESSTGPLAAVVLSFDESSDFDHRAVHDGLRRLRHRGVVRDFSLAAVTEPAPSVVRLPDCGTLRESTPPGPSRLTQRVRSEVEAWWGGPWPMRAICFTVTLAFVRHVALWTGLDLPGIQDLVHLVERVHEDVPGV